MTSVTSPSAARSPAPDRLDDRPLFEIIDGQVVELPPMSILASRVASRLMSHLGYFRQTNPLGEALMETLIRLPVPAGCNRRPDVAFVSAQRIAEAPPQPGSDNAWDVVPELMVEVISPHDLAEEIMERLGDYWAAGARLVWVVYPTQRLVYVYEAVRQVRVVGEADELDGRDVLPGLRIPIAALFAGL
jgi:Uma2 family endonuclease